MLVRELGEFELIRLLECSTRERNRARIEGLRELGIEMELGIGDDAAAWTCRASTVVSDYGYDGGGRPLQDGDDGLERSWLEGDGVEP